MSRDEFRRAVFERDNFKCVNCGAPAVDAHHLLERRLWPDGGYCVDNGVSLCADCHLAAERTDLSVELLRLKAGITNVVLPPHLYPDARFDKWGNEILEDGRRLHGELFEDESVQKVLAGHLSEFTRRVKYPRTYHLPWSHAGRDDRTLDNTDHFKGREVVITEKMDGENTTIYSDGFLHARSVDGRSHPSRAWVKNLASKVAYELPAGWRVCGENLYAKHSIAYTSLPSYFLGFSVWDDKNVCQSWDDTLTYFGLLGITSVPVIYRGVYDYLCIDGELDIFMSGNQEGYVVRLADSFHYKDFRMSVAKYVRANHVQTLEHWMFNRIETNKLGERKPHTSEPLLYVRRLDETK